MGPMGDSDDGAYSGFEGSPEERVRQLELENEFFHHRGRSGMTIPEFRRMLDAYLRYCNEERPKEKLGWMSPMRYRRSLGPAA